MKGISKEEHHLIDELYKKTTFFDVFKNTNTRKIEILQTLANSGSMFTLTFLLPFALDKNQTIRKTARDAIHQIISSHRKQDLIGLDQYIRRLTPYQYSDKLAAWHQLLPESIRAYHIRDDSDVSFIGICSFHRNGYVREAAIEVLSKQASGADIPFLFLRLNDWQPKIRFLSFKAIKQKLHSDYVKQFLDAIYLIKHLSEYYTREKFSDLVDEIYEMFGHPQNRNVLLSGFHSKDPIVRRFCFEIAIKFPDIDRESVISEAFRQSDALIRLQMAKHICRNDSNECLNPWLKRIGSDVFPPIRQLALQAFIDRFPEQSIVELRAALLDQNKTIREMARYYLKDLQLDFPSFYREKLKETDKRLIQAAIVGLGETGEKTDAQWITPFLFHDNARMHRSAIKALGMLNPEDNTEVFISSLQSDKRSVSREARQILAGIVDLRQTELLWKIFENDERPHVKKNILFLFTKLSKADSILFLLRACATEEKEIRDTAIRHIELWASGYNTRFYVPMSDEKRKEIKDIFDKVQVFLPEYIAEEFEFIIDK
ncbi:HEAT repeat domain-containing protein [Brevibacillus sp. HD3.3A]|uniref:HEAT repeat domain-containing protein n=1 Tax=Brevibacillus sp. HD3.3A TaxID=2738979 RepID=UPI00156B7AC4|nr:HEAT repeat domain-containing protein [Brevibacillus sp. HD3.3A]UED69439.1 HEAT repeat domain-containing protein [Brevibacillus sp. HD3.3A]